MRHLLPPQGFSLLSIVLITALILPAGCASRGGRTYGDAEVRKVQTVQYGTVLDVTEVMVEEDPSFIGPAIGGATGGVLGSLLGRGTGRTLFIIGGAALGALMGAAGEAGMRRYPAVQLTVELENGQTLVVVQGNDEVFVKGDPVRLLQSGDGSARVQHR
ncbi:MAG: glycine zipper 2TM domain-containing protein [Desulfovibrio sp.]|jgi:outer membrane lipoprotein SlyB|nr:glycine zipper 2TM domain-containing protein [Desulfovibrio sp.]